MVVVEAPQRRLEVPLAQEPVRSLGARDEVRADVQGGWPVKNGPWKVVLGCTCAAAAGCRCRAQGGCECRRHASRGDEGAEGQRSAEQ